MATTTPSLSPATYDPDIFEACWEALHAASSFSTIARIVFRYLDLFAISMDETTNSRVFLFDDGDRMIEIYWTNDDGQTGVNMILTRNKIDEIDKIFLDDGE